MLKLSVILKILDKAGITALLIILLLKVFQFGGEKFILMLMVLMVTFRT